MTTGSSLYAPSRRPQWLYDALAHESARVLLEVQALLKEKLTIDLPRPIFKHGRAPAVAQLHVQIEYGSRPSSSFNADDDELPVKCITNILAALATLIPV